RGSRDLSRENSMQPRQRLTPLDSVLRLVTNVKAGEGATAVLLAFNLFLVLGAWYAIKPVRKALVGAGGEAMFGPGGGAKVEAYCYAGIVLLLTALVPLYGRVASRMPRRRLINVVTTFFAANLVILYLVFQLDIPLFVQGVAFYIWASIFNVMVIAQFWSFANDIYKAEEGERLFPIVAFGASLGGVIGGLAAGRVIPSFGVYLPLLLGAALLMVTLLITNYIDARERHAREADLPNSLTTGAVPAASQEIPLAEVRAALSGEISVEDVQRTLTGEISLADVQRAMAEGDRPRGEKPDVRAKLEETARGVDFSGTENPFLMVLRCPYLLMIGLAFLLLNWVNSGGEIILSDVINASARNAVETGRAAGQTVEQLIGGYWAGFYTIVNIATLLIQLFIVSRVIKYLGVGIGFLVLPLIALGAYSLMTFYPVLAYMRWAKIAENSTDYSLNNTARHALILVCTREQKYKAKQVVDSFSQRAGDFLVAPTIFIATVLLGLEVREIAPLNILLAAIWFVLAVFVGREYRRLVAAGRPPCVSGQRRQ
ncbi:MAG: hypothetical protein JSU87_12245, partial [Gemmatimonadota bacterium]